MSPGPGPLRVLGLVTDAYGGRGGIAQYNRDFYDALASLPGIAAIDLLPRGGRPDRRAAPAKVRLHRARAGRVPYALAAILLAWRVRPGVVICGHLFMVSLAASVARWCRARLVVQLHGIEIWTEPAARRRRDIERADLVLCVSRDTRVRVLRFTDLPPERVVVLPNTVSDAFEPGAAVLAPGRRRLLLSVGRLDAREAYKGHDAVVACLPDLAARGYDVEYRIAGAGDDGPRLERLAGERGVSDRVHLLGEVSGPELVDLYRRADLFVLPSSGEGFGIVFLEAMACGTPALGLAAGGAVDALDGLGRLVAGDERLADAIATELDRAARGDRDGEGYDRAARVQARFGRSVFGRGVASALARLHPEPLAAARETSDAASRPDRAGRAA